MAIDRDDAGDPVPELPALAGELDSPRPDEENSLLAADLVDVVDGIRHLNTEFGLRPYRVFLVHGLWSGGQRGRGTFRLTSRTEITPVPQVEGMGAVAQALRATGLTEEGDITVSEISARYTEGDLLGRTPDLVDRAAPRTNSPATDFWWEVQEARPSTPRALCRRFFPVGVPELDRGGFQWTVRLVKQDGDRGRDGEPARGSF